MGPKQKTKLDYTPTLTLFLQQGMAAMLSEWFLYNWLPLLSSVNRPSGRPSLIIYTIPRPLLPHIPHSLCLLPAFFLSFLTHCFHPSFFSPIALYTSLCLAEQYSLPSHLGPSLTTLCGDGSDSELCLFNKILIFTCEAKVSTVHIAEMLKKHADPDVPKLFSMYMLLLKYSKHTLYIEECCIDRNTTWGL